MKILKPIGCGMTAGLLVVAAGCHDAGHSGGHSAGKHDDHAPPHGGTPVLVAEDKFHLELVRDEATGKIQAYVLDGHLEKFVQVPETNFVLLARAGGKEEQLSFQRAPDPAAGGVPLTSILFEAQSDWVKSAKEFEGRIPTITLKGRTFTNISFTFPKGTKHVH